MTHLAQSAHDPDINGLPFEPQPFFPPPAESDGRVTADFVRELIRQRAARSSIASGDYFTDPPWDLLLALTAARLEDRPIPVLTACRAANITEAAALRWINAMVRDGLLVRRQDDGALGEARVTTSEAAHARMLVYLADLADGLRRLLCSGADD